MTSDCSLCRGIPGVGAGNHHPTEFDEILAEDESVVIVPTRGMLVPGYVMAVTRDHINSFGDVAPDKLPGVLHFVDRIALAIGDRFGVPFIFEHGSPRTVVEGQSQACILHAHQHIVPVPDVVEAIRTALPWQPLHDVTHLQSYAESGYAYFVSGGQRWVVAAPPLPGQWVRRYIARSIGAGDLWDWEAYPGQGNLEATLEVLRSRPLLSP